MNYFEIEFDQTLNKQNDTYTSPLPASYCIYFVNTLQKHDRG